LGTILNSDPIGKIIINEHKILEGFLLALFNDKVQKHDINYVLENEDCVNNGSSIVNRRNQS
jgi:hypothetical protein